MPCGQFYSLYVRCDTCHAAHLVAFSCKRRSICPRCGARRMAETAALLVDEVLPDASLHQWLLSVPHALRVREPAGNHRPLLQFLASDRLRLEQLRWSEQQK